MKQFWFKLTVVVVVASSAAGWAQVPKTSATGAPPTQPASSSPVPVPAAAQQQAAVAPAAGGSTGGPLDPNRYVIGAEDSLQISVWKDPTLSGTVPVRPDGMISMNLVGDLKAAGLTPMALSASRPGAAFSTNLDRSPLRTACLWATRPSVAIRPRALAAPLREAES